MNSLHLQILQGSHGKQHAYVHVAVIMELGNREIEIGWFGFNGYFVMHDFIQNGRIYIYGLEGINKH